MLWFTKKKNCFDYFEEHVREMKTAGQLLKQLFADGSGAATVSIAQQIKAHEHIADLITHALITQMSVSNFIPPLDRDDILSYIKALDDVLDCIHDIGEAYTEIYGLTETTPYAKHFVDVIVKAIELLVSSCIFIRTPSQHVKAILQHSVEIHQLENEGDQLKKESLRNLFVQLESQKITVPTYLAWSDIYHMLEDVTDKIEDCANIIEQITLKYS